VNDGMHRITAYEAAQKVRRNNLVEAVKTTGIAGQGVDDSSLGKFAEQYAAVGGKQAQFNKFMLNEYKAANTSQASRILRQLQDPFSRKMQVLMGGRDEMAVGKMPAAAEDSEVPQ
jgi:hypothetical protein